MSTEELEKKDDVQQEQLSSVEKDLVNLSEQDLDNFETLEEYMNQTNQQVQVQETSQEQPNSPDPEQVNTSPTEQETQTEVTESGSEEPTTNLSDKEFRQLVTATFKANHKEFSVDNPDEIRKLMQYGLNYHKKMTEIAPRRKALKTLEQHGLLNPDKLNYAIELLKGDKGAIAQLLKEHSVDTFELPDLEENPYRAKDYLPTTERINFDEKVEDLKNTSAGTAVVDYVKNLDNDSFYEIYTNPNMMDMIQSHVESGLFNDATALLEKERALGKVPANVKDIDAYAFVAQHLQQQNPSKYSPNSQPKVLGNNLNKQVNQPVNQAKVNAGIPANTMAQNTQQTYSGVDMLLNASEEDLDKFSTWEEYLASNNLNFQR